jgi:hypothetical protein
MRFRLPKWKNPDPTSPRVGIIYLVAGELLIDSTPLAQAGRYGEFKIHGRGHIDYWAELVKSGKVPHAEYEESPRGRVAFHPKTNKFGLLADQCILSQEKILGKIFSQLHIPLKDTAIGTDSHYRCFRCLNRSL